MSYQSINPYNGECLERFEEQSDLPVETAVATATACFETRRKLSFAERANIISKAAAIMRGRAEEFARTVTQEMGKLFAESVGEVMPSADILDYYATNAARFLGSERLKLDSRKALVKNSPLGVLFGVQPWNFPYHQLARFADPNLMAGNVVRVKHSGTMPQCAVAFGGCGRRRVRRRVFTPVYSSPMYR
jgi:succinate-semialdehyde dehydrogenase/glutarate-semialdehyde dehydrogenase